jgi:hypothetical protein
MPKRAYALEATWRATALISGRLYRQNVQASLTYQLPTH